MSKITPEEEEIKALKRQLRGLEIVLRQNADLESEVTRLNLLLFPIISENSFL